MHRAAQTLDPALPPLAGFVTPDGGTAFDPEGLPTLREADFLRTADPSRDEVVLGIGQPRLREKLHLLLSAKGFTFPVLRHPSAILGPRTEVGAGSVLMAGSILETHVRVGLHALINVHVSVTHEGRIGDFCSLGPGVHLAGAVTLGQRCDLGVGAVVRPCVQLGDDVIVGAGAAVVKDHRGPVTLVGVPAEQLA